MEKRYYTAASLERVLVSFERKYGLSSDEVFQAHRSGADLPDIPGFHRHVWVSFYRDVRRLRGGDDFATDAERVLEIAAGPPS